MQDNLSLTLTRVFNAPIEKVWESWSDPELFAQWYGSPGKLTGVTVDFKVGGLWRATTVMPDGGKYPQVGVYRVIDGPTHLQFDFPDPDDIEDSAFEVMDIHLQDLGGKTEMVFHQSGGNLPAEEYAGNLKKGWTGFFNKLAEVIE